MTREETVKWIKEHRSTSMECKHDEAMRMAIRALEQEPFDIETYCKEHFCVMVDKDLWEKAEKALEQETLLDKIRTEIKLKIVKRPGLDFKKRERDRNDAFLEVLDIIDKYKTESEES